MDYITALVHFPNEGSGRISIIIKPLRREGTKARSARFPRGLSCTTAGWGLGGTPLRPDSEAWGAGCASLPFFAHLLALSRPLLLPFSQASFAREGPDGPALMPLPCPRWAAARCLLRKKPGRPAPELEGQPSLHFE